MVHSGLAHTPIFLRRDELTRLPRWWTLTPKAMEPWMARQLVTPARAKGYDPRRDPFLAYEIRMGSILKAWEPIWNQLGQDPQYRGATRVLFSDHGERFYHATPEIRLGGIHGYNLDPWEARIMFKVDGPGFGSPAPGNATLSILGLRDALDEAVQKNAPLSRATLESDSPVAPLRYHVVGTDLFTPDPPDLFRQMPLKELLAMTGIVPGGIWFTKYEKSFKDRSEDVSIGFAQGPDLEIIKPLKKGGALSLKYVGYDQVSATVVSEEAYKAAKERCGKILSAHLPGSPFTKPAP
jgi:hypothetical protein